VTDAPYRVVDSHNQSWLTAGPTGEGGHLYNPSYSGQQAGLQPMTLPQLAAGRGGWRPVVPATDEEEAAIEGALRGAGRKAVASVCAALEVLFDEVRQAHGGLTRAHDSYEAATRTLVAGRPGSWESAVLIELVLAGNGFNLVRPKGRGYHDVDRMRANGPVPRVDKPARDALAVVFRAWACSPDRYVEVAETLASIVSRHADREHGADGWKRCADQWLQPDAAIRSEDFSPCYRLLYSQSEHFNSSVI
jgi:hypothetical protein